MYSYVRKDKKIKAYIPSFSLTALTTVCFHSAGERHVTSDGVGFPLQREGCGELEASDPRALIPLLYCLRSAAHLSDAPANRRVLEMAQSAACTRAVIHGCNSCCPPHAALQLPPSLHHRPSLRPSITLRMSSISSEVIFTCK